MGPSDRTAVPSELWHTEWLVALQVFGLARFKDRKARNFDTVDPQTGLRDWLKVWGWCIALYAGIQLVSYFFFDLSVWRSVWLKDGFIHLLLGSLLFLISRGFWSWALSWSLIVIVFQISNALKLVILGSPVMPDDFGAAVNMFLLLDDWRLWLAWAALTIPIGLLLFSIHWLRIRTWLVFILLGISSMSFATYSPQIKDFLDQQFGDRVWDQPGNYKDRGLILHLLHETSRNLARGQLQLTAEQVMQARQQRFGSDAIRLSSAAAPKRNVHLILLESFWDPTLLQTAKFSSDPLDPRFRQLWKSTDNSTALAPVFGGYTANSEFEILCGFPVFNDAVFFEGWLRNDVPCLPRYLADSGYRTIASHPNFASFWNRVNAYNRIGFTDYWSINDFLLDDMNREFLSDVSLYRQVWDKLAAVRDSKQPLLNYIVTYFGHLDYPLSASRPNQVSVENAPAMVEKYANTLYYKSRELMDFYAQLRAADPDAIIVIFGDHLPFLGPKFAGFVEAGLLQDEKGAFTVEMFRTFTETPLIIIDGENGPVKREALPMYRLPALVTELLGEPEDSLMHMTDLPAGLILRPLPGITLALQQQGDETLPFTCVVDDNSGSCVEVNDWITSVRTLSADIFTGERLALSPP